MLGGRKRGPGGRKGGPQMGIKWVSFSYSTGHGEGTSLAPFGWSFFKLLFQPSMLGIILPQNAATKLEKPGEVRGNSIKPVTSVSQNEFFTISVGDCGSTNSFRHANHWTLPSNSSK